MASRIVFVYRQCSDVTKYGCIVNLIKSWCEPRNPYTCELSFFLPKIAPQTACMGQLQPLLRPKKMKDLEYYISRRLILEILDIKQERALSTYTKTVAIKRVVAA